MLEFNNRHESVCDFSDLCYVVCQAIADVPYRCNLDLSPSLTLKRGERPIYDCNDLSSLWAVPVFVLRLQEI